jgi:hypothetical protein
LDLAYLHLVEAPEYRVLDAYGPLFPKAQITNSGYDADTAARVVGARRPSSALRASFSRTPISPSASFAARRSTRPTPPFYEGGARGYVDYAVLATTA